MIPQLVDGVATSGILPATYYNQALIDPLFTGSPSLEVASLPDAQTVFAGFDQLVVKNNGAAPLIGGQVNIGSFGQYTLPTLAPGEIWTTHVPAGTAVGPVVPIVIDTQPDPVEVYVGGAVHLEVAASGGGGALAYQWRKNGVDIPGATSATFDIASGVVGDTGVYTCRVSDTGLPPSPAVISDGAQVSVYAHLQITQDPSGGTRFTNPPSNFTFYVATSGGFRSLNYEWQMNGMPIVGAPSLPYYVLDPVTESAAGTYSVRITDMATDEAQSGTADLVVNPLSIVRQPLDVTVTEPAPVNLSIEIQGGRTLDGLVTITYQWYRHDSSGDTPIPGATTTSLTLNPTSASDTAEYFCQVTDGVGPLDSDRAYVLVLATLTSLSIVQQPAGATIDPSDAVTFTVAVEGGSGTVNYVWKKDGSPIPSAPNAPVYTIPSATESDEGQYSVDVSDDSSTVPSSFAPLSVNPGTIPALAPLGLAGLAAALGAVAALRIRRRK
jgi:hypothetical protein